jgi:uncharacterized membrane protein
LFRSAWSADVLSLAAGAAVLALILLNVWPAGFRFVSLKARSGLAGFLPLFMLLLYAAFRLPGRLGRLLSSILAFSLFALAVNGLWQSGASQSMVFNGIVPLSDASEYYAGALGLLGGQDLTAFAARRPLFPGFFAVLLAVTNRNLLAAIGILTAVTAAACCLAAGEIRRTHGAAAAVLVLTILFAYYRYFAGVVVTETLGLPLGALGFALIWRGTSESRQPPIWLGLFMLTLALNARAGTFFVLPALLWWGGRSLRAAGSSFSWRFVLWGAAAIAVAFLLNGLLFRLLADPSATLFSNFSYSLFGLASGGKSYLYVFTLHPLLVFVNEPYQSREIYRLALEQIRHSPDVLWRGMLHNWSTFLFNPGYGAYSYLSGNNTAANLITRWLIYALSVLGVLRWASKPSEKFSSLVMAAALGVFLSVPFVPPTDASHLRLYAASIPVLALPPALGWVFLLERLPARLKLPAQRHAAVADWTLVWLSGALTAVMFVGPVVVRQMGSTPLLPPTACEVGSDSVVTRFDAGTYFSVVPDSQPLTDGMPVFHLGTYRRNSHGLSGQAIIDWALKASPPFTVFSALDYRTRGEALIRTPTGLLPHAGSLVEICGAWVADHSIWHRFHSTPSVFYAQSITVLSR